MPEKQEISIQEQLKFIEEELRLKEFISKSFESDSLQDKFKRDVVLMKAVRDTLNFECLMERAVNAEYLPQFEESKC